MANFVHNKFVCKKVVAKKRATTHSYELDRYGKVFHFNIPGDTAKPRKPTPILEAMNGDTKKKKKKKRSAYRKIIGWFHGIPLSEKEEIDSE